MARHARRNTWFALKAAHARLVDELAAERFARFDDQLEIARGIGLIEELTAQRDEAVRELASTRRDLQQARELAARPDPYVQMLAGEASELRAIASDQQRMLRDLIGRLMDLLDRTSPVTSPPPSRLAPPTTIPMSAAGAASSTRPQGAPTPVENQPPVPADRGGETPVRPPDSRPEVSGRPVLILAERTDA